MNELDPLVATHYPELYPQVAFEPESQSRSPMSRAGGITEGESFSVGNSENPPAANADGARIDRSMDDVVA